MNNFLTLTKLNLKLYIIPDFKDKKERKKFLLLFGVIVLSFILPAILLFISLYTMAALSFQQGNTVYMLSAMFTVSQIMVIVFSSYTYFSSMFFAKDNEILLNFPIGQRSIFASKLVVAYISELVVSCIIIIPTVVITAVAASLMGVSLSVWYYIAIPFAIILLPLIPLLVLSVLSFPIVWIINKLRKKPLAGAIIQALFVVVLFAVIYMASYGFSYNMDAESMANLSQIFAPVAKINFIATFLTKAMCGISSALNLFLFLICTLVLGAIAILISGSFYKTVLQGSLENGAVKFKKTNSAFLQKLDSPQKSFFFYNMKNMMRNSSISVNVILTVVMPTVMVIILSFIDVTNSATTQGEPVPFDAKYFLFAMCLMMSGSFSAGSNIFATIGFSLERENFALLKTLPVDYKVIFNSKLLLANIVSALSSLVSGIAIVVVTGLTVFDFLAFFVLNTLYSMAINAFSLSRDAKAPKLNWINIKELTKNNFHVLVPVLLSFGSSMIVSIVAFIMAMQASMTDLVRSLIIWGVFALVDIILLLIFAVKPAEKSLKYFEEIEP